jgi:hypothetical protein
MSASAVGTAVEVPSVYLFSERRLLYQFPEPQPVRAGAFDRVDSTGSGSGGTPERGLSTTASPAGSQFTSPMTVDTFVGSEASPALSATARSTSGIGHPSVHFPPSGPSNSSLIDVELGGTSTRTVQGAGTSSGRGEVKIGDLAIDTISQLLVSVTAKQKSAASSPSSNPGGSSQANNQGIYARAHQVYFIFKEKKYLMQPLIESSQTALVIVIPADWEDTQFSLEMEGRENRTTRKSSSSSLPAMLPGVGNIIPKRLEFSKTEFDSRKEDCSALIGCFAAALQREERLEGYLSQQCKQLAVLAQAKENNYLMNPATVAGSTTRAGYQPFPTQNSSSNPLEASKLPPLCSELENLQTLIASSPFSRGRDLRVNGLIRVRSSLLRRDLPYIPSSLLPVPHDATFVVDRERIPSDLATNVAIRIDDTAYTTALGKGVRTVLPFQTALELLNNYRNLPTRTKTLLKALEDKTFFDDQLRRRQGRDRDGPNASGPRQVDRSMAHWWALQIFEYFRVFKFIEVFEDHLTFVHIDVMPHTYGTWWPDYVASRSSAGGTQSSPASGATNNSSATAPLTNSTTLPCVLQLDNCQCCRDRVYLSGAAESGEATLGTPSTIIKGRLSRPRPSDTGAGGADFVEGGWEEPPNSSGSTTLHTVDSGGVFSQGRSEVGSSGGATNTANAQGRFPSQVFSPGGTHHPELTEPSSPQPADRQGIAGDVKLTMTSTREGTASEAPQLDPTSLLSRTLAQYLRDWSEPSAFDLDPNEFQEEAASTLQAMDQFFTTSSAATQMNVGATSSPSGKRPGSPSGGNSALGERSLEDLCKSLRLVAESSRLRQFFTANGAKIRERLISAFGDDGGVKVGSGVAPAGPSSRGRGVGVGAREPVALSRPPGSRSKNASFAIPLGSAPNSSRLTDPGEGSLPGAEIPMSLPAGNLQSNVDDPTSGPDQLPNNSSAALLDNYSIVTQPPELCTPIDAVGIRLLRAVLPQSKRRPYSTAYRTLFVDVVFRLAVALLFLGPPKQFVQLRSELFTLMRWVMNEAGKSELVRSLISQERRRTQQQFPVVSQSSFTESSLPVVGGSQGAQSTRTNGTDDTSAGSASFDELQANSSRDPITFLVKFFVNDLDLSPCVLTETLFFQSWLDPRRLAVVAHEGLNCFPELFSVCSVSDSLHPHRVM